MGTEVAVSVQALTGFLAHFHPKVDAAGHGLRLSMCSGTLLRALQRNVNLPFLLQSLQTWGQGCVFHESNVMAASQPP